MRVPAIAAALLCAMQAGAIPPPLPADLAVKAELDRPFVAQGERAVLRVVVENRGPFPSAVSEVSVAYRGLTPLPASGAQWQCAASPGRSVCSVRGMPEETSIALEIPVIATATGAGVADVLVQHRGSRADHFLANNTASATIALGASSVRADAAIRAGDGPADPVPFGPHARTVTIENQSDARLSDVTVYIAATPSMNVTSPSAEWTCLSNSCTLGRPLNAGASVELPLELRPPFNGPYDATLTLVYSGGVDIDAVDNTASFATTFGVAGDYEAILVPLLANGRQGAFGSSWSNGLSVFSLRPGVPLLGWGEDRGPCAGGAERMRLADTVPLWPREIPCEAPHGVLLYAGRADSDALTFTAPLYEGLRAVAEVPVVRERDFRQTIALPQIAPSFARRRYALRVYSLDAEPGAEAWLDVRPFRVNFEQPFRRELVRHSDERIGPGLPRHPAYAEFSHEQVVALLESGFQRQPVTLLVYAVNRTSFDGPRIWAMLVSVDNDTQQPIFVTPQ